MGIGVYPGSFNPPTVAHLAIARAALDQCGLERVDLVLSRDALGKVDHDLVAIEDRATVLRSIASTRPWLGVRVTDDRLIGDIAEGYDVVILGADKWVQINELHWYGGSADERDAALARLPHLAAAPRPPFDLPFDVRFEVPTGPAREVTVLDLDPDHQAVSATEVRGGRRDWMATEAVAFDDETGAWSDPDRYRRVRRRARGAPTD